ncbi:MAG: 3-deoxy-manno-octulosonate cytidylyltransferase [Phycisphaerales bacterium]
MHKGPGTEFKNNPAARRRSILRRTMFTSAVVLVPARLASTRLPEKMLANKTGKPLVQHVVESVASSVYARGEGGMVAVAADHPKIAEALAPYGTRVIMTSRDHPNGTSRLAQAAELLSLGAGTIVVNAQGDEPEMSGRVIDAAVKALVNTRAYVATCCAPFVPGEDPANPNIVKVVRRPDGMALYFSRALVPHDRDGTRLPAAAPMRHVGVYAYRVGFLRKYVALAATPLEQAEKLEQLRILEHGYGIAVAEVDPAWLGGGGIDTPEQYEAFVKRRKALGTEH